MPYLIRALLTATGRLLALLNLADFKVCNVDASTMRPLFCRADAHITAIQPTADIAAVAPIAQISHC